MGIFDLSEGRVTAEGVMPTLRCANPDCNNVVAQAHFYGSGGVLRILGCCKCGRASEYENGPRGVTVKLLPKKGEGRAALASVPKEKQP